MGCSGPALSSEIDDVRQRVLDIRVGVGISQRRGQTLLQISVGGRDGRMGPEEVTNKQCIALVGLARLPDVYIASTGSGPLHEEEFRPFFC